MEFIGSQAIRGAIPSGECIGHYQIIGAIHRTANKLCYRATDRENGEEIRLVELTPYALCARGDDGTWYPYRTEKRTLQAYHTMREDYLAKMQALQNFADETALEEILAVFEEKGTVWIATRPLAEGDTLACTCEQEYYTIQHAIGLLAPVMDTLVALHAEGICHGAISEHTIVVRGEVPHLTGWGECSPIATTPADDIRDIARLLCRLTSGKDTPEDITAKRIARVLQLAIDYPDSMTMGELWSQLHSGSVRLSQRFLSVKGRLWRYGFVLLFLCFAIPCLFSFTGASEEEISLLQDTAYTLSEGEIQVPDLLYLTKEEVQELVGELGLYLVIAAYEDNPVYEENTVIVQSPKAGTILSEGDSIVVTLSDGWYNYVPDVMDVLLDTAMETLEDLGFVVEYEEVYSSSTAPNAVLSQSIEPNTRLERGSVVLLVVSLGREDIDESIYEEVGDYVGMDFEEARSLLSDLHLYALQFETVYSTEYEAGVILSQDIEAGTEVAQGTIVNMVVSLGVEMVRVPDLTGMTAANAVTALEELGLMAVRIYVADASHAINVVLSQDIASGTLLPLESEVWLTVSVGSASYVISTGGWSGNPLPTASSTETESESESESDTETETQILTTTETDRSETSVTTTTVDSTTGTVLTTTTTSSTVMVSSSTIESSQSSTFEEVPSTGSQSSVSEEETTTTAATSGESPTSVDTSTVTAGAIPSDLEVEDPEEE